jgi:citrate synthase
MFLHMKAINAKRAATMLGVKPASLYAYVSRGLIKPVGKDAKRQSLFKLSDVEKLKARSRSRSGIGAVAEGALRWGEPVLESSITQITKEGPSYRGVFANTLAENDRPFENVCELLWAGIMPEQEVVWSARNRKLDGETAYPLHGHAGIFLRMMNKASQRAVTLESGLLFDRQMEEIRCFVYDLAFDFSFRFSNGRLHKPDHSVAGLLAVAANKNFHVAKKLINRALVVCADHELTASTFVARVSASTGANPLAAISAAFGVMSGTQHGAHFKIVAEEIAALRALSKSDFREHVTKGEVTSGFLHTLYPGGDPRSNPLVDLMEATSEIGEDYQFHRKICAAMKERGIESPTIDLALLMVCTVLEISNEFAAVIFGIARIAGLFAHYQEQRMSGYMVRPRARYNGR